MKAVVNICLIIAAISLIIGIISRTTGAPIGPMALQAPAFLKFTNTCLLVAIAFIALQILQKK